MAKVPIDYGELYPHFFVAKDEYSKRYAVEVEMTDDELDVFLGIRDAYFRWQELLAERTGYNG